MRTLDPILQAAMDSGNFTPIVRAAVLDPDDHTVVEYLDLVYYKINGIDIDIEFYDPAGGFSDSVSLERGAKIGDTEYTIFSGIYRLSRSYRVKGGKNGLYICSGSLVDPTAVEVPGDVGYHAIIDSVMDYGTNAATFKNPAAAWLNYQFLPDGQSFLTTNIYSFFALLRQKYLIHATENGIDDILFFSVADTLALASQYTISLTAQDTWSIHADYRQFVWKDEAGTFHNPGPELCPIHNLGYLESTASPPSIPDNVMQIGETVVTCIPNLKYQTGDCVQFDPGIEGGSLSRSVLDVTEIFNAREHKSKEAAWYMELRPLAYFSATPGGYIPPTAQYTTAYSQLATHGFVGVLNQSVTNVQALADAVDQYSPVQIRVTTPTLEIAGKDFAWSTADGKLYVWTGAAWSCVGPYFTSITGTAPIVVSPGSTPVISITGVDATHAGSVPLSGTPANRQFLRAAKTTGAVAWDVLQAGDIPDLSGYYQPLDDDLTYLADIDVTRGAIIRKGLGNWEGLAKGSAYAVLTGDGTDTLWSTYLLSGTAGGKMNFAVTNAKTLTLTATNCYNLTIPATGTAVLLSQANSFTLINPITTIAESWIGPSTTNGIYFKGGNIGIGSIMASGGVSYYKLNLNGTQLYLGTDSTSESPIFKIAPGYISSVHSSYTTTTSFVVYDAMSDYECMRFDAVSEPMVGFYGHAAVVQQSATTDLGTVLSNLGLRYVGTAYPITTSGAVQFTGGVTISTANLTITDKDIALSATTGTKIGTATNQKLSFFNSTPIIQPLATMDLGTVLSNLGLRAAGTAYPITTSGAVQLTGGLTISTLGVTITDVDIALGTTTGTKIGTAASQKLGFFGTSPIIQPIATLDLGTVLSNLGLRAAGTAYPITTSGAVQLTGGLTLSTLGVTITDVDIALGSTTGTKFGTATTQKLGFFNATPIIQPVATTDLGIVLSNLGLRAAGTAYPITTSGAVQFTGGLTITTSGVTITDVNVVLGTTTGTKFGTATTQKLGFFNATPIIQPVATTDLGTVLSNLGLRASGTAYPITTSGAIQLTGGLTVSTLGVTITDVNIALGTTTGTKFGTATTQKLSFYNATPIIQPSAYTQTYSTASKTVPNATASNPPAGGTGTAAGGYDTAANRNLMITSLTNNIADVLALKKVVNAIIDDLQSLGLFS